MACFFFNSGYQKYYFLLIIFSSGYLRNCAMIKDVNFKLVISLHKLLSLWKCG